MRTIDADALFINLEGMMEVSPTGYIHGDTIADMISDAPTIEPEPKWIPCKECLPEVGDYVICSQENGDVGEGKLLPDGDWLILYESAVYGIRWVTAWMPLPKRYREEGGE